MIHGMLYLHSLIADRVAQGIIDRRATEFWRKCFHESKTNCSYVNEQLAGEKPIIIVQLQPKQNSAIGEA